MDFPEHNNSLSELISSDKLTYKFQHKFGDKFLQVQAANLGT